MRLGRRLVLLTAVAALLGGPVAGAVPAAAAASQGWVRRANLSPGTPEDIYLYPFGNPAHPTVLRHVGYGGVSDYMPVSVGQYTVAMRPVGAPASSPPSVSTSFMVSSGTNYTVASIGSVSGRRLEVLQDQMAGPAGSTGDVLVRVIQASGAAPDHGQRGVRRPRAAAGLRLGHAVPGRPAGDTHGGVHRAGRACRHARHADGRLGPHHRRARRDLRAEDRQPDRRGQPGRPAWRRRDRPGRDRAGRRGLRRGWPRWPGRRRLLPGGSACAGRAAPSRCASKWCSRYGGVNASPYERLSRIRPISTQMKTAPRDFPGAAAGKCLEALTWQPLRRSGQPQAARAGSCTRRPGACRVVIHPEVAAPGRGQSYFPARPDVAVRGGAGVGLRHIRASGG